MSRPQLLPFAAAAVSVVITLAIFGIEIGNPLELGWLQGDAVTNQFGSHQYRNDPDHYFPVVTSRASYPLTIPVAMFGTIPFVDLVLKPFSSVLPQHFQYLGPLFVIGVAIQALVGWALLEEANPGVGSVGRKISLFIGGVLFATAPVMLVRFYYTHISLAMHWPILLSMLIYLRSYRLSYWHTVRDFSAVSVISAAIMPYVWAMVSLIYGAFIIKSLLERKLDWSRYVLMAIPLQCGLLVGIASGFLHLGGAGLFEADGFGHYSANFLALVDPLYQYFSSGLVPDLGVAGAGQYEGFGYAGVGVLLLISATAAVAIARRRAQESGPASRYWPLFVVAAVSYVWAMSHVMAFGVHVVELPVPAALLGILQNFRSSGRFVAVVVYILTFLSIATLMRWLSPNRAAAVMVFAAVLQTADLAPAYAQVQQRFSDRYLLKGVQERFTDQAYRGLGRAHHTLLVVPPWQCRDWLLPKADYPASEFLRFSNLVMDEGLRTNSFYAGRLPVVQGIYHCEVFPWQLPALPTDKQTAYLLTPRTFALFGGHIAATHNCDFAEDMIICRGDRALPGLTERARARLAATMLPPATSPQRPELTR